MLSLRPLKVRRKARGYTVPVSALATCDPKLIPFLDRPASKADAATAARLHAALRERLATMYARALDVAAWRAWGRPFGFCDYRVAGIGSYDFAERDRRILRALAHSKDEHGSAAYLYASIVHPRSRNLRASLIGGA